MVCDDFLSNKPSDFYLTTLAGGGGVHVLITQWVVTNKNKLFYDMFFLCFYVYVSILKNIYAKYLASVE